MEQAIVDAKYSISRKNGETTVRIPPQHPDYKTLAFSTNFAFLLPWNCAKIYGAEFAGIISKNYVSPQAIAVAEALCKV